MSKRRTGTGLIALLLGSASMAEAQTTAQWQQRLERLDQVVSQMTDTERQLARQRQAQLPVDTIRVGALVVFAPRSASRRIRPAADSAWRILSRFFGDRAQAAGATPVLVQYHGQPEGEIPEQPLHATTVAIPAHVEVGWTAMILVNSLEPAITKDADPTLRDWGLSAHTMNSANPTLVYDELATAPWSSARACFLGRISSCRLALGISGHDPISEWFDETDRRHYVRRMVSREALPGVYEACTQGGEDSSCDRLLRQGFGGPITPPFSAHVRQLLLGMAIDTGGSGAFERLIATENQPLDARLAAAAGIPIDSLVGWWRGRVLAAHPKTVAADERAAWAAVGWGVLLIAIALRSSRWR
jgi:hypothetical protein